MASGIYMCPICYKIYDSSLLKFHEAYGGFLCPDIECDEGGAELFEVDELMVKPIRILNQKYYCTLACCSGHLYGNSVSAYIMFDERTCPEGAPKGWIRENKTTIRYNLPKKITSLEYIMDLIKWCEELPENEDIF